MSVVYMRELNLIVQKSSVVEISLLDAETGPSSFDIIPVIIVLLLALFLLVVGIIKLCNRKIVIDSGDLTHRQLVE